MQSFGGGIGLLWAVGDSAHTWYPAYLLGSWLALGRPAAPVFVAFKRQGVLGGEFHGAGFSGFCKSMEQDAWLHSVDQGGGRASWGARSAECLAYMCGGTAWLKWARRWLDVCEVMNCDALAPYTIT